MTVLYSVSFKSCASFKRGYNMIMSNEGVEDRSRAHELHTAFFFKNEDGADEGTDSLANINETLMKVVEPDYIKPSVAEVRESVKLARADIWKSYQKTPAQLDFDNLIGRKPVFRNIDEQIQEQKQRNIAHSSPICDGAEMCFNDKASGCSGGNKCCTMEHCNQSRLRTPQEFSADKNSLSISRRTVDLLDTREGSFLPQVSESRQADTRHTVELLNSRVQSNASQITQPWEFDPIPETEEVTERREMGVEIKDPAVKRKSDIVFADAASQDGYAQQKSALISESDLKRSSFSTRSYGISDLKKSSLVQQNFQGMESDKLTRHSLKNGSKTIKTDPLIPQRLHDLQMENSADQTTKAKVEPNQRRCTGKKRATNLLINKQKIFNECGTQDSKPADCSNKTCKKLRQAPAEKYTDGAPSHKWIKCCGDGGCPLNNPTSSCYKLLKKLRECCETKECLMNAKVCDIYEPLMYKVPTQDVPYDEPPPSSMGQPEYHYLLRDVAIDTMDNEDKIVQTSVPPPVFEPQDKLPVGSILENFMEPQNKLPVDSLIAEIVVEEVETPSNIIQLPSFPATRTSVVSWKDGERPSLDGERPSLSQQEIVLHATNQANKFRSTLSDPRGTATMFGDVIEKAHAKGDSVSTADSETDNSKIIKVKPKKKMKWYNICGRLRAKRKKAEKASGDALYSTKDSGASSEKVQSKSEELQTQQSKIEWKQSAEKPGSRTQSDSYLANKV